MTEFTLNIRGKYYRVTPAGYIDSGDKNVSMKWRIYGIAKRWNQRTPTWYWKDILRMCKAGKTVEGYLHDIDHGTYRIHMGSYNGKIPKARIWKR